MISLSSCYVQSTVSELLLVHSEIGPFVALGIKLALAPVGLLAAVVFSISLSRTLLSLAEEGKLNSPEFFLLDRQKPPMAIANVVQNRVPRRGVSVPGPNKACRCHLPGSWPTIHKKAHPCQFQSRWVRPQSELPVDVPHSPVLNSAIRHHPSLFPNHQLTGWMPTTALLARHGRKSFHLSTILCFMIGSRHSWRQYSTFVSNLWCVHGPLTPYIINIPALWICHALWSSVYIARITIISIYSCTVDYNLCILTLDVELCTHIDSQIVLFLWRRTAVLP